MKFFKPFYLLLLISASQITWAKDFKMPHKFTSGEVLSSNVLNDVFSKITETKKTVTEQDLLGRWDCKSYFRESILRDDIFDGGGGDWHVDNDNLYAYMDGVELEFSDDGDGTYTLTSNEPNPVSPITLNTIKKLNTRYKTQNNALYFIFSSMHADIYRIDFNNNTRVTLTSMSYASAFGTLVCDKQDIPPDQPTLLEGELSNGSVSLTWTDNSSDETEFKIYRRDSLTGEFEELDTTTATTYTDTLSANGVYWYRVSATNENGESLGTNVIRIVKE